MPVARHRRSDLLDPDLPPVDGCRSDQYPERFDRIPRSLSMRMPDARDLIAHMYALTVSDKTVHSVTPHTGRSSGHAVARPATTLRSAGIAALP